MAATFADRNAPPDDAALTAVLGPARALWDALAAEVAARCPAASAAEWKYYGAKHGWQVKFLRRRRALLYAVPHEGGFTIGMALRPAGVEAVAAADLPAELKAEIATARTYGEGRPARVFVTDDETLRQVRELLRVQIATSG